MDLLRKVAQNTVIVISTLTGSGKSTMLPALLMANGYEKIIVTQPRRLPCQLLSNHVNSKIAGITGWAVSGIQCSADSPIIYLTDGLLKEYLLFNEKLLLKRINKTKKGFVFFIDEVHERSINIDLCLALLARLLSTKPQLTTKIKIIISWATLDIAVSRNLFHPIKHCQFEEFILPTMNRLYNMTKHVSDENVLDLVQTLYPTLRSGEKMLCFFKSTLEVMQSIKLLKDMGNNTIDSW
ncbi:unnamed protein product [Didymodactylos carnosus]|uniref:Helicase ATP-binding domain-containing protein n=1 Tax=Didymodactylos carnosus TaxID=1234261 RepID=A0A815GTL6_9BILA|nr:unnamed protein product [Didymodactylos carnosus]CAF1344737.1 unnamed protein product [Didymodactylos carnosus]CAF3807373.1 unnamed protein product [Didymodactylos carnosus]CAF4209138.1 unnamed protein product [Didymodactylos carnosus]